MQCLFCSKNKFKDIINVRKYTLDRKIAMPFTQTYKT